jgi:ribonuclease VapC
LVLDTSAIVAIILEEPVKDVLIRRIGAADSVSVGAPTILEAAMVPRSRLKRDPLPHLERFLYWSEAEVVAFRCEHMLLAMETFARYGKGLHPAALNFGDCMAYAIAAASNDVLLYTGSDFSKTDIRSA